MSTPLPRLLALTLLPLGVMLAADAHSQSLPRSYVASPDIYNVIAQNEQTKVILVTWKPGQRDVPHSHPASAVYFLDDCSLRVHAQDRSFRDVTTRSGTATVQAPIPGHMLENTGTRDCRMVMFEPN